MIAPAYVVTMARYNAWQNKQMMEAMVALGDAACRKERKAFFGSIFKTANHLLWGDMIWLSRFEHGPPPEGGIEQSVDFCPTLAVWTADRFRTDGRLLKWAGNLAHVDLHGDLTWYSGAAGREMTKPLSLCITHMFNHQTHHRGQIHAMITAAGGTAPVSDVALMPENGPWL